MGQVLVIHVIHAAYAISLQNYLVAITSVFRVSLPHFEGYTAIQIPAATLHIFTYAAENQIFFSHNHRQTCRKLMI